MFNKLMVKITAWMLVLTRVERGARAIEYWLESRRELIDLERLYHLSTGQLKLKLKTQDQQREELTRQHSDEMDGERTVREEIERNMIGRIDDVTDEMERTQQTLAKTQSRLEVRELEVKELSLVIAKLHSVQETEMAISCMKTEFAKSGGVPYGRNVPE